MTLGRPIRIQDSSSTNVYPQHRSHAMGRGGAMMAMEMAGGAGVCVCVCVCGCGWVYVCVQH